MSSNLTLRYLSKDNDCLFLRLLQHLMEQSTNPLKSHVTSINFIGRGSDRTTAFFIANFSV